MSLTLLCVLILGQLLALLTLRHRRAELARMQEGVAALVDARATGSHDARLQHPFIDLSRCIGCETCVKACPEEGVLELIHGQAMIVHGARCVGHGLCAKECPVGAIALTLGDVSERKDLPVLTDEWESTRTPGLFLAGEVTGYALIRTAIEHGRGIADAVARRVEARRPTPAGGGADRAHLRQSGHVVMPGSAALDASATATLAPPVGALDDGRPADDDVLDLCVVGAGPAGLSCSLQARSHGLRFVTLEQQTLGGTVASYPRRKLVMTQPVDLPLHGRLDRGSYTKEELIALWQELAERHALPIRSGVKLLGVEPHDDHLLVRTSDGDVHARHVCLALGRRGTPRKLGVPGEHLPKVAYSLIDASSYRDRRVLVVGGGDSAVEAALGLAEQPGNEVTLSYRRDSFSRIKARNQAHLQQAIGEGRLAVLYGSLVTAIAADHVTLDLGAEGSPRHLPNDEVFVMAGGEAPFELLERSGVSFDPTERPATAPLAEQGTGLARALGVSLVLALGTLSWVLAFSDYYLLPAAERFASPWHAVLRPSGPLGLGLGVVACALVVVNLTYLVRRSRWGRRLPGSLKGWMTSHVVTGILATLLVLLHGAMAPRATLGGQAFAAFAVLLVTGAVGRYLYSFVPRAANGRELQLDEVRARVAALSSEWDRNGRGLADAVRAEIDELVGVQPWSHSLLQRVRALLAGQRRARAIVARLRREALAHDVPPSQVARLVALARQAHRTALMAAHYEDLRALLSSWRFLHRWVALLMVALVTWHVITALRYGEVLT